MQTHSDDLQKMLEPRNPCFLAHQTSVVWIIDDCRIALAPDLLVMLNRLSAGLRVRPRTIPKGAYAVISWWKGFVLSFHYMLTWPQLGCSFFSGGLRCILTSSSQNDFPQSETELRSCWFDAVDWEHFYQRHCDDPD